MHLVSLIFGISGQEGKGKLDAVLPSVNQLIYVLSDVYAVQVD